MLTMNVHIVQYGSAIELVVIMISGSLHFRSLQRSTVQYVKVKVEASRYDAFLSARHEM